MLDVLQTIVEVPPLLPVDWYMAYQYKLMLTYTQSFHG